MFQWDLKKKIIVGALVGCVLLSVGCYFGFVYQSPEKTDRIFKAALEDFNRGDYQNSYYQFSKISMFSPLKPIAIYHRAECARMLADHKSELRQYERLYNNYSNHKLGIKAKYLAAQKLVESKPEVAKKYFNFILNNAPDTDYAIASKYYLGILLKNKYQNQKIIPTSIKEEAQDCFRYYIKKAPGGKYAYNAVLNWLEFVGTISKEDYLLMAKTCYQFGEYQKALDLLDNADDKEAWALKAKILYNLKDFQSVKSIIEQGLQVNSQYVPEDEIFAVIDLYLKSVSSQKVAVNKLLGVATGKGIDYLLNLKCQNVSQNDKVACYTDLYLRYPEGRFSPDALSNMFWSKLISNSSEDAKKIGLDHLNKFPDSKSAPMVMFWLGKIAEKSGKYDEYTNYYKNVINKYPDSYYAYRAYLRLKKMQGPIISSYIEPQPVVYPYKYSKNNILVKLVEFDDFEIVNELAGDDDFIKSWVLYEKGDYSRSMLVAREAMEKLSEKPDKHDLRWRLVYPVIYYDEIRKFAGETGNNPPLMLGLIREESYFDPLAQSIVGASGLMQLMPTTAAEINSKMDLNMNISDALFNPRQNIKLGNYYYESLRASLNGYDVSPVAAYNGGIGSLKKWKTSLKYSDTDEFVEQIPYPETKNYVKKVFRSYWNYVRIYQ